MCAICFISVALAGAVLLILRIGINVGRYGITGRIYHVDIVYRTEAMSPIINSFKSEMDRLGYREGKNIVYEQRNSFTDAQLLDFYIQQLIADKSDLIVALGNPVAKAVQQKTSTIPTVFYTLLDPVDEDLIASFQSSENNLVGIGGAKTEISQIEIMKNIAPLTNGFGAIVFPDDIASIASLKQLQDAGRVENVTIVPKNVDDVQKIGDVFDELRSEGIISVYLTAGAVAGKNMDLIVQAAIEHHMLLMAVGDTFVEAGALVSLSVDADTVGRSLADMTQSIFEGKKPTDMSSSYPTKSSFVINKKTAEAVGITIPEDVLTKANKVY